MTFVSSEFTFLFYIKNSENNLILSNKPLLIINNDNENYSLNHIRDIDFQTIVEENEEIELGIIRIPKKGGANIFSKVLTTKNIHQDNVFILFSKKYKVNIKNKISFLQESTRGDDYIDINHHYKLSLTYIKYVDMDVKIKKNRKKNSENQKDEYILCIPNCSISSNFIQEFKRLI